MAYINFENKYALPERSYSESDMWGDIIGSVISAGASIVKDKVNSGKILNKKKRKSKSDLKNKEIDEGVEMEKIYRGLLNNVT